jgi:hypothetical protein
MYTATFRSVGNPDYGQTGRQSEPKKATAETVEDLCFAARLYIEENNLGGGNWPMTKVYKGKKVLGHISYNGRYWPKED